MEKKIKKKIATKQGINVSIKELRNLLFLLKKEGKKSPIEIPDETRWLLTIVNKTPECSDTWEFDLDLEDL